MESCTDLSLAIMFSGSRIQYCSSFSMIAIVIVINVVAIFGTAQIGFLFYQFPAKAAGWQLKTMDYSQNTRDIYDSNSLAALADHSSYAEIYPVCVILSIGDDTGRIYDAALPFSSLYRLFDAAKAEISKLVDAEENSSRRSPIATGDTDLPVKLLVGVDYASIACKMARDSFQHFTDDFKSPPAGVELTCNTPEDMSNTLGNFSRTTSIARESLKVGCKTVIVGGSNQYVTQLTLKWVQLMRWENLRIIDLDGPDLSHSPPTLPRELWQPTVVTTFSTNHFTTGCLLLRSIAKAGKEAAAAGRYNISIVVFALENFTSEAQGHLECLVREINEDHKIPTEIRQFNFSAYPSWMRINQTRGHHDGGTGEYAWKAVMIHSILVERGFILWVDAGCRVSMDGLTRSLDYTRDNGFANTHTVGQVPDLLHSGMIMYFRYQVLTDQRMPNCDGSRIGLTLDKYESLVRPWYDCSLTRQCIAPDGSSRWNHRQDQSALTVLAHLNGSACEGITDIWQHMDGSSSDVSRELPTQCYQDPLNVVIAN